MKVQSSKIDILIDLHLPAFGIDETPPNALGTGPTPDDGLFTPTKKGVDCAVRPVALNSPNELPVKRPVGGGWEGNAFASLKKLFEDCKLDSAFVGVDVAPFSGTLKVMLFACGSFVNGVLKIVCDGNCCCCGGVDCIVLIESAATFLNRWIPDWSEIGCGGEHKPTLDGWKFSKLKDNK